MSRASWSVCDRPGEIGAPLEAEVTIYAPAAQAAGFVALADELRFLLITSQAKRRGRRHAAGLGSAEPRRKACGSRSSRALQPKCVRCWHLRTDVGSDARHPELCARCVVNIEGPGEERRFA